MNPDFKECSGNPASCPENEGYGCCMPNPTKPPIHLNHSRLWQEHRIKYKSQVSHYEFQEICKSVVLAMESAKETPESLHVQETCKENTSEISESDLEDIIRNKINYYGEESFWWAGDTAREIITAIRPYIRTTKPVSIVDKALINAADILANFKACEAHEDGGLERKLEEWQACYAKLFTQMNELVQSTKPVITDEIRLKKADEMTFAEQRAMFGQVITKSKPVSVSLEKCCSAIDRVCEQANSYELCPDNMQVELMAKAVLDAAGVKYVS